MKPPTSVALPPVVVTTTSTAPALPGGVTAITLVLVTAVNGASAPSKVIDWVVDRLVPVIVTAVPPSSDPELGDSVVTVGVST